jgi:hypothetical protein
MRIEKGKGAFVSEDALHIDDDKPNSVSLIAQTRRSFISSHRGGTPDEPCPAIRQLPDHRYSPS